MTQEQADKLRSIAKRLQQIEQPNYTIDDVGQDIVDIGYALEILVESCVSSQGYGKPIKEVE